MVKLLGISGSLRAGSYNSMLVREAARVFAPDEFVFADLRLPSTTAIWRPAGYPIPSSPSATGSALPMRS